MRQTTGEKQTFLVQAKSYKTISGSTWEAMLRLESQNRTLGRNVLTITMINSMRLQLDLKYEQLQQTFRKGIVHVTPRDLLVPVDVNLCPIRYRCGFE
ncbi:MAG: hypothetical protein CL912_00740 [Deltaproteobacteria bacterium]|nr:hypothetical protein [Deltaproteobacteria bacterium]